MSGIRAPTMNLSPASSIAARLASDSIPASATTVTSGKPGAAAKASITGKIVFVSAVFPSNARTCSGKPAHIGQQADGDLRLQPTFLGEPGLAEPVTLIGLEVQRGDVVEHQRRWAQPDMRRAH